MRFHHRDTEIAQRFTEIAQRFTEKNFVVLCAISVSLWLMILSPTLGVGRAFKVRTSQEGLEMATQDGDRIHAPELTGARGWLNTDKPLPLSPLRGKVVLLDF